ncbi:MAG: hypothetical protein EAZ27_01340 [Cytophagales bacterium]|nr:MAG: hypothetical protein EAZ27_01340 [Cytophagales bacterium]
MKKYSVLICLVMSAILLIIAASKYPGGSLLDKKSMGFGWTKNFISNLFATKAINGLENTGRIWAILGMAFQSVGYGLFFINMSKKFSLKVWASVIKYIGFANIFFIFLIATPYHDLGTISIVLTLFGLFIITFFIFKTKHIFLKFFCVICLLTYYSFFFFYGFSFLELAFIMQKVYSISSMLLVLGLEYFTKFEDFMQVQSKAHQK